MSMGPFLSSLTFCGLEVDTLVSEICLGDGAVAGKKVAVVKGLKKSVAGDATLCACDV